MVTLFEKKEERYAPPSKKKKGAPAPTVNEVVACAASLILAVYYLAWVAPGLVPLPPGTKVAFPLATRVLEALCEWCGRSRMEVVGIAAGLLGAGFLLRLFFRNYFYTLAIGVALLLGFTWYSISAPVDRLIHSVEENLPKR
jgi:hypothetical protein